MRLLIEIPDEMYKTVQDGTYCGSLYEELKNGIPQETVTEFADRCRECGREKVLDKIMDEIYGIDDKIVLNPDSAFDRKAYVRLNKVIDIIDKYRGESKDADSN